MHGSSSQRRTDNNLSEEEFEGREDNGDTFLVYIRCSLYKGFFVYTWMSEIFPQRSPVMCSTD
jgi:hypothetical protein